MSAEFEQKLIDEAYLELVKFTIKDWSRVKDNICRQCTGGVIKPPIEYNVKFKNKNFYRGSVNDAEKRLQGKGRFRWPNQTKYQGDFDDNLITGHGKMICEDETKYVGGFKAGYRHGQGYYFNDNITYKGEFSMGKKEGYGTLFVQENNKFEGMFKNDKRFEGIRTYENGVFEGNFDIWEMRKDGLYKFDNGDTYKGHFRRGRFSGFGIYTWNRPNYKEFENIESDFRTHKFLNVYKGYWQKNLRHGCGILQQNGCTIVTLWASGLKWGPGLIFARNGDVYVSNLLFEGDQYVTSEKVYINEDSREKITNITVNLVWLNKEKEFCEEIRYLCFHHTFTNPTKTVIYPLFLNAFGIDLENTPIVTFVSTIYPEMKLDDIITKEKTSLNHLIRDYVKIMTKIYSTYALFGNYDKEKDKPVDVDFITMTRLGLFQFYRDLEFHKKGENVHAMIEQAEIAFNIIRLNQNDPYEPVLFGDFIKHLLNVTFIINKNRNVQQFMVQQRPSYLGLFATMLTMVLRDFIIPLKSFAVGYTPNIIKFDRLMLHNLFEVFEHKTSTFTLRNVFQFFHAVKLGKNWLCERELNLDYSTVYDMIDFQEYIEPYIPSGASFFESVSYDDCFRCCCEYFPELVKNDNITQSEIPLTFLDFFEIVFLLMRANYKRDVILPMNSFASDRGSVQRRTSRSSRISRTSRLSKRLSKK